RGGRPVRRPADGEGHRGAAADAHAPARIDPDDRRGRHPFGRGRRREDGGRGRAGAGLHRPGLPRAEAGGRVRRGDAPAQGGTQPRHVATRMSACRIVHDADLAGRNTFGVAVRAPLLVEVADADALPGLFDDALRGMPVLGLGGGSNLLFAGPPEGAALALAGRRQSTVEARGDRVRVRAEAGADWDAFVRWTLAGGLAGLENLALIPGTVGAAPIQNIGAYGTEVREAIVLVDAFEPATGAFHRFTNDACGFAYRDSRFKREAGRYVVTAVEFELSRGAAPRVGYA